MKDKSPVQGRKQKPLSDFQENSMITGNRDYTRQHVRSISIKINRNKLPADFFPRTESLRKNQGINPEKKRTKEMFRKAESEREHYSHEKTSFFGFFQEQGSKKNSALMTNLKRKFESRQQPKRQKITTDFRHFTPVNGIQRSDLLYLYPDKPDFELTETLMSSTKAKGLQISPRKEHLNKYRQFQQQAIPIDPQKQYEMQIQKVHNDSAEPTPREDDAYNITFFNAKSTSFPPINRNKNSD